MGFNVCEIFNSIQGEGINVGRPCTFVRFAGCNLKCEWCDTKYAWNPHGFKCYSVEEILAEILEQNTELIIFTGGEPLIQNYDDLLYLVKTLVNTQGKEVNFETNGTIYPPQELLYAVDLWSVSPKLSSSKNPPFDPKLLEKWQDGEGIYGEGYKLQLKFVIQTKEDMKEVAELFKKAGTNPLCTTIVFQPEGSNYKQIYPNLPKWVAKFLPKWENRVRYLPQVHRILDIK